MYIGTSKRRKTTEAVLLKRTFPNLSVSKLTATELKANLPRLFLESNELSLKFSNMWGDLCDSLEERKVPIKRIISRLIGLEAFPPVYTGTKPSLFSDLKPVLIECNDIDDIWAIIKDYCSYFNYYLVEFLTSHFGSDDDKKRLTLYKQDFIAYAKRRVYECPTEFGSFNDGDCSIVVKLDKSYDNCTLEQLIIFEKKLCDILKIFHDGVLRLCTVEQGCYELTFQAPSFIKHTVFPLSPQQEDALKELKVVWLLCGDYEFTMEYHVSYIDTCMI